MAISLKFVHKGPINYNPAILTELADEYIQL